MSNGGNNLDLPPGDDDFFQTVKLDNFQRGPAHPIHERPAKPRRMPRRIGEANDGPDSASDPRTWVTFVILAVVGGVLMWWLWQHFGGPQ